MQNINRWCSDQFQPSFYLEFGQFDTRGLWLHSTNVVNCLNFFQYWPGSPNGPKQKSRTTKSPLMQDWVFRLGVWLFSFVVWNLWYHYMWPQQLLGLVWSWSNSLFSLLSSKANYSHNMVAWNTFFIFDLSFKVHVYLHMETYEANGWCFDRWFSIGIC